MPNVNVSRPVASVSLFEPVLVAPAGPPAVQPVLVHLVADSLQRTVERFEQYLSCPLTSSEERESQVQDARACLSLSFQAVAAFLPGDLSLLVRHFVDLYALVVLREVQEG